MNKWEPYSSDLDTASKLMGETNDCTVRAWVNVFDAPYSSAHRYLEIHGRKKRKGLSRENTKKALLSCKKAKVRFGDYSRDNRITVSKFCKKHPVGRYYVASAGHAFCIKDGVVHDWKHGPARQITFAARVYLEGEI